MKNTTLLFLFLYRFAFHHVLQHPTDLLQDNEQELISPLGNDF
ncbi:hypothetical protein [Flavobacterium sp. CSZ]|nr:hypothetical protein [Flavobacterium sp. CSZ]